MVLVDFHQHLWPAPLVGALRRRESPPFVRGDRLVLREGVFPADLDAHDLERRIALLDEHGLDVAVVSLQPTLGLGELPGREAAVLRATYHAGIEEAVAASGGRLVALACDRVLDGFAGTCVSARRLLEPDGIAPLAEELLDRGQLLFVHPGATVPPPGAPGWWAPVVDYTAQMQAAYAAWLAHGAARWPDLPVVFAMLAGGAPIQLERLRSRGFDVRTATAANTYLETSSYGRLALELSLAAFGVERLVLGTDTPVLDPAPTLTATRSLGKAALDAISRSTPARLLALDPRRLAVAAPSG